MSETPDNRQADEEANALLQKIRETLAEAERLKTQLNNEAAKFQASLNDAKTELDARRGAAEESERQITTIKSAIEGFRTNSQTIFDELNGKAEIIRKTAQEIDKTKSLAETNKNSSIDNQNSILEIKNFFETKQAELQAKVLELSAQEEALKEKIASADEASNEIIAKKNALTVPISEIENFRNQAEELKNKTNEETASVSEIKNNITNIQNETNSAKEQLNESFRNAEVSIEEIRKAHTDITSLHDQLLRDSGEGEEDAKSISTEITAFHSKIETLFNTLRGEATEVTNEWDNQKANFNKTHDEFFAKKKDQFEQLRKQLEGEIRELLPGAGAAGLSWTYVDAKGKYGPTDFEYQGDRTDSRGKKFLAWMWHSFKNYSTPVFLYVIFLGPLIPVFWYFLDLLNFAKEYPGQLTIELLLLRTAISVPLITVSLFGLSSIRLYRRLFEEYNHKQRVMQLYDSFKREFDKVGNDDQRQALLSIMLATVGDKPSLAMHKYDINVDTSASTFNFSKMIADAFKGRS